MDRNGIWLVACVLLVVLVCVLGGAWAIVYLAKPAPVRAFNRHRDAMTSYAKSVISGSTRRINGTYGDYAIPEELARDGICGARKSQNGTVYLVFGLTAYGFNTVPNLLREVENRRYAD